MLRLILTFLLFVIFVASYFYGFVTTIPYFSFIQKFNLYEYLKDNLSWTNRAKYISWVDYTQYIVWWKKFVVSYTGFYFTTPLHYLFKSGSIFWVYVPVIIVHTGDNVILSADKLFDKLDYKKDMIWYTQIISGENNYINVWKKITSDKKIEDLNIYLWKTYLYCSLTWVKWIDAYFYDRYLDHNLGDKKVPQKIDNTYVCKNDISYKWCPLIWDSCDDSLKIDYCLCSKKGEYWICEDKNLSLWWGCNAKSKWCIDYYTGMINLNNTNCSLSGLVGQTYKAKYFLVR